jgi:hypothetical protein
VLEEKPPPNFLKPPKSSLETMEKVIRNNWNREIADIFVLQIPPLLDFNSVLHGRKIFYSLNPRLYASTQIRPSTIRLDQ